jgi:hypothetical protein
MTTTFQKRQKEMKRLDKQREKAARRAQRKLDKRAEKENPTSSENLDSEPERPGSRPARRSRLAQISVAPQFRFGRD